MLILTRYVSKELLKVLLLCMGAFVALYLLVDLFNRLDDILDHRVPVSLVFQYIVCSIPLIVYQLSPFAVLLSTFITIGIFVKYQEITALKAHGISLYRVMKVFLLIPACMFVFSLWMQEYLIPFTGKRAEEIKEVNIKDRKLSRFYRRHDFWYRSGDSIYNVDFYDPEQRTVERITILSLGPRFSLKKRIDAQSGVWAEDGWLLHNGLEREFDAQGTMRATPFSSRHITLSITPEDFDMARLEGEHMGISEIWRFIRKIKKAGYNAVPYEVDMHAKISYAFINIIMGILGIPFALRIGRSGSMAQGIALSIAIGFTYWLFNAFCLSLGKGGALPPLMSAWIANATFGLLGMYLFLHVRQ